MKTLILIAIFICITLLSAFAQQDKKQKPDPREYFKSEEPSPIPFTIDSSFVSEFPSVDSIFNQLHPSSVPRHGHLKWKKPGNMWRYREMLDENNAMDNMPCYKPQGNYTMPVYKPDSTSRYTLLIK